MYSILISTFSLAAHSLHSLVSVSLAPGTQWSQKPTLSLPAAKAPCTNGTATAVAAVVAAAALSTARRVSECAMFSPSDDLPARPAGLVPRRRGEAGGHRSAAQR